MTEAEMLRLAGALGDLIMTWEQERIEAVLISQGVEVGALIAEHVEDPVEAKRVLGWVLYGVRYALHDRAQRRALPLLRGLLTPEQRRDLRSRNTFVVHGSAGGRYRLAPHGSRVARTERRGARFYDTVTYCYHDPEGLLPPADVMMGVMFALMTDEPGFLAEANERPVLRR